MIEQEVTCEGDLFPLCHDFCLAALDLAIDTFSADAIYKLGPQSSLSDQSRHPQTQQDELRSLE